MPANRGEVKAYYLNLKQGLGMEETKLAGTVSLFSWLRLMFFLLSLALVYFFASSGNYLWLAGSISKFVIFIVLIVRHQKLFRKLDLVRIRLRIVTNELELLDWKPSIFDNGDNFREQLPFADDLDLFGKNSVFHYVNRCSTQEGANLLAQSLLNEKPDAAHIRAMQVAVKSLRDEHGFRLESMTLLFQSAKVQAASFKSTDWEQYFPFIMKRLSMLRIVLPLVLVFSVGVYLFGGGPSLFVLSAIANLLIASSYARRIQVIQEHTGARKQSFATAHKVFERFCELNLKSELLSEMQQIAQSALKELHRLGVLSEWFDRRSNVLLYFIGNALFQLDINLLYHYGIWRDKNRPGVALWFETLGRLEMITSIAVFAFNNPEYVFPESADEEKLMADNLAHPLIPDDARVANSVQLCRNHGVQLVTGSNMAGKSTYLRTLGVNVLLAQAGAPVCASAFIWKPCVVLSSLRQSDSLHENTSLFMNELKQLKYILERARNVGFSLILLDELLRGTNTDDKYSGTYALLRKISDIPCLAVVATHDLRLGALEQEFPDRYMNYCFESYLLGDQLKFDYKIKRGIASGRNATWLMRSMNLID